jgi:hypothetical protein
MVMMKMKASILIFYSNIGNVVQEMFTRNLEMSIRKTSLESVLTCHTIHSVLLKELHHWMWKPHLVQQISSEDGDVRMEFSQIMVRWKDDWSEPFDNILSSNEGVFHVGGFVNRYNRHY